MRAFRGSKFRPRGVLLVFVVACSCSSAVSGETLLAPSAPWMNTALRPDERADLLLAQMTQDEQLQMVHGLCWREHLACPTAASRRKPLRPILPGTAGYVPGIPRLGIPPLIESDAGLGIANGGRMRPGDKATALPSGSLTAATWNPDVAQAAGAMIGAEARDRGFNVRAGRAR